MKYTLYVCDTETTGLSNLNDIIELSLIRLGDDIQKTWKIKPINPEYIDHGALKINGHKFEDITHQTKFGKDTYLDASKVIIEIENWLMEDDNTIDSKILIAHNLYFDKMMLENLWKKCNSFDTFPFGRRTLDTISIEFFMNYCEGKMEDSYSLNALTKKYGIVNSKAHSAEADTKAAKELFEKQIKFFKKALSKNE